MHKGMCMYMSLHVFLRIYILHNKYTHIHIYIYIYIYMHTYIYTQECADKIVVQDNTINVCSRGRVMIKGKGIMHTYWVKEGVQDSMVCVHI
jgi:hypothetical protein